MGDEDARLDDAMRFAAQAATSPRGKHSIHHDAITGQPTHELVATARDPGTEMNSTSIASPTATGAGCDAHAPPPASDCPSAVGRSEPIPAAAIPASADRSGPGAAAGPELSENILKLAPMLSQSDAMGSLTDGSSTRQVSGDDVHADVSNAQRIQLPPALTNAMASDLDQADIGQTNTLSVHVEIDLVSERERDRSTSDGSLKLTGESPDALADGIAKAAATASMSSGVSRTTSSTSAHPFISPYSPAMPEPNPSMDGLAAGLITSTTTWEQGANGLDARNRQPGVAALARAVGSEEFKLERQPSSLHSMQAQQWMAREEMRKAAVAATRHEAARGREMRHGYGKEEGERRKFTPSTDASADLRLLRSCTAGPCGVESSLDAQYNHPARRARSAPRERGEHRTPHGPAHSAADSSHASPRRVKRVPGALMHDASPEPPKWYCNSRFPTEQSRHMARSARSARLSQEREAPAGGCNMQYAGELGSPAPVTDQMREWGVDNHQNGEPCVHAEPQIAAARMRSESGGYEKRMRDQLRSVEAQLMLEEARARLEEVSERTGVPLVLGIGDMKGAWSIGSGLGLSSSTAVPQLFGEPECILPIGPSSAAALSSSPPRASSSFLSRAASFHRTTHTSTTSSTPSRRAQSFHRTARRGSPRGASIDACQRRTQANVSLSPTPTAEFGSRDPIGLRIVRAEAETSFSAGLNGLYNASEDARPPHSNCAKYGAGVVATHDGLPTEPRIALGSATKSPPTPHRGFSLRRTLSASLLYSRKSTRQRASAPGISKAEQLCM